MSTINSINNNLGNQWILATKSLTATQVKNMFSSPVLFDSIPQAAANQVISIRNWGWSMTFNTTAYTSGAGVNLYYDNTRTQTAGAAIAVGNMTASVSSCPTATGIVAALPGSNSINKPIYISNATQNFATGDSPVTFYAYYSLLNTDASSVINCVDNIGSDGFRLARLYIPSAQVQTLNTIPVDIVPSPGSGKIIVPDRLIMIIPFNSIAYTGGQLQCIYKTSGQVCMTGNLINASSTSIVNTNFGSAFSSLITTSNADNNALQINLSVSPGSGDSPLIIYLSYSIITL